MLPIAGQVLVAAFLAVRLRANLPLSVALVFVTNPLTMPVIFYAAYKLGALLLGTELLDVEFDMTWDWIRHSLVIIWQPFLLGCFLMGLGLGTVGYLLVSALWRWRVSRDWHLRRERRKQQASE